MAQGPVSAPRTQQAEDSLIALLSPQEYDSIMTEIDDLFSILEKKEFSYADFSITAGNGNVTFRNTDALNTSYRTANRLLISPSAGYFHKSGLGVQWVTYFAPSQNKLNAYQHQPSVFFDYTKAKKISGGISYTRNIVKESAVDFMTTPFKNQLGGYLNWKKGRLRPSLSFTYSKGDYVEQFTRLFYSVKYKVLVSDVTASASVRYSWSKRNWLKKEDYLVFMPRLALVSSGQKAEVVNSENNRILGRLLNTGFMAQRSVTNFEPQVLALYLSLDYTFGKWYIHPQYYIDYYLHSSDKRSFSSFSVTTGFMF